METKSERRKEKKKQNNNKRSYRCHYTIFAFAKFVMNFCVENEKQSLLSSR